MHRKKIAGLHCISRPPKSTSPPSPSPPHPPSPSHYASSPSLPPPSHHVSSPWPLALTPRQQLWHRSLGGVAAFDISCIGHGTPSLFSSFSITPRRRHHPPMSSPHFVTPHRPYTTCVPPPLPPHPPSSSSCPPLLHCHLHHRSHPRPRANSSLCPPFHHHHSQPRPRANSPLCPPFHHHRSVAFTASSTCQLPSVPTVPPPPLAASPTCQLPPSALPPSIWRENVWLPWLPQSLPRHCQRTIVDQSPSVEGDETHTAPAPQGLRLPLTRCHRAQTCIILCLYVPCSRIISRIYMFNPS
jgi:hypothetical protein